MSEHRDASEADDLQTAGEASWAKPLKVLRKLPKDDLIHYHDVLAVSRGPRPGEAVRSSYWRDELHRREEAEKLSVMVRLTWAIAAMTLANVAAVVVVSI